jgi:hypothetical protein
VRRLEGIDNLPGDDERFVDGNGAAPQPVGERVALDQLEDEKLRGTRLGELVDRGDVVMVESGDCLRFTMNARDALRIGARAEQADDLVDAKACSELEGQATNATRKSLNGQDRSTRPD